MSIKTFFKNIMPVSRKEFNAAKADAAHADLTAKFHKAAASEAHRSAHRAVQLAEQYRAVAEENEAALKAVVEGKKHG